MGGTTAIAAGVILATGWERADPIARLLVAALMTKAGIGLVGESARVFLEAAPRGIDPARVEEAILAAAGVVDVHEPHVFGSDQRLPALSAHVLVDAACDCHGSRVELEEMLATSFGIDHTTLQVDHRDENDPVGAEATPDPAPATTAAEAHANRTRSHAGHAGTMRTTGDHHHSDGC